MNQLHLEKQRQFPLFSIFLLLTLLTSLGNLCQQICKGNPEHIFLLSFRFERKPSTDQSIVKTPTDATVHNQACGFAYRLGYQPLTREKWACAPSRDLSGEPGTKAGPERAAEIEPYTRLGTVLFKSSNYSENSFGWQKAFFSKHALRQCLILPNSSTLVKCMPWKKKSSRFQRFGYICPYHGSEGNTVYHGYMNAVFTKVDLIQFSFV